jgi:hypothetical protein
MRLSSKVFDVAQREQRRIYGATRESAVLPRGWLSSKAPNPESQHEGVLALLLSALWSLSVSGGLCAEFVLPCFSA